MVRKAPLRPWAVGFWLLVWQAASMALRLPILLPSPLAALARLGALAVTASFWRAIVWSALRILGGFLLACLLAAVLAVCASRRRWVRELLAPPVAAVKAVPVDSFIILALVWLDSRRLPLLIAGLMVFPAVYLHVMEGIGQADRQMLEMARVFRVSPWRQAVGIYLPAVLPGFRAACSLGLGLCWKAGVAAEVIGLPRGSLGERLYMAKVYFETADLFAWTAVIVAVSMAFEAVFLRALDALAGEVGAA